MAQLALDFLPTYPGDRLNFGLAAEQARAMGLAVAMVIVADDVALGANRTRARGIAGTAFVCLVLPPPHPPAAMGHGPWAAQARATISQSQVHKVAGHAAASRRPLADVARAAQTAADTVVSIGAWASDWIGLNWNWVVGAGL
jgi:dihydroxyacetone kinase